MEKQVVQNKNLIACKTCGVQIAKSAKTCPSCGAKNKSKSKIKVIIPLVIIIILTGLYGIKIFNFNGGGATLTVDGTEYSWTEYKNAYHDYYLNGKTTQFKDDYLPAQAEITGKITKISNSIIGETMKGNMPTRNTLFKFEMTIDDGCTYYVTYGYYEQNDYDFSHLSVGDKVTVKGEVTEEDLFPTNIVKEYLDAQLKISGTLEGIVKA